MPILKENVDDREEVIEKRKDGSEKQADHLFLIL